MSSIRISEVREIKDPQIKSIAETVLNSLKVETEKGYASFQDVQKFPLPDDPKSTERVMAAYLGKLPAEKQRAFGEKAVQMVSRSGRDRINDYGEIVGKFDLTLKDSINSQLKRASLPREMMVSNNRLLLLNTSMFNELTVPAPMITIPPFVTGSDTFFPQSSNDKMQFRLHRVKCMDETGPAAAEIFNSDRIAIGGVATSSAGDTIKIPERILGRFNDGTTRSYSNPLELLPTAFDLRAGGDTWPKGFTVSLILVEKDLGGFAEVLAELWDKVKEKVIELISAAATAASTALVGGLGAIIGPVVGWVVGKFAGWLIKTFRDDLFTPVTLAVDVPSIAHLWPGNRADSPNREIRFRGHGGDYRLTYDWQRTFSNPPVQPRKLTGSIVMYARDDDFGRDPRETARHTVNLLLSDIARRQPLNIPNLGVGGEVRLELNVNAQLRDTAGTILIEGKAQLYEGTSESTSDLDDEKNVRLIIAPNATESLTVNLKNRELWANDVGKVTIRLSNRVA